MVTSGMSHRDHYRRPEACWRFAQEPGPLRVDIVTNLDIVTKLGLADRLMPKWKRFVDREPKIQHGEYFFLQTARNELAIAIAAATNAGVLQPPPARQRC